MQQASRIFFALILVLVVAGTGVAYFALTKQQGTLDMAPTERARSHGNVDTVVGDETPFSPEW